MKPRCLFRSSLSSLVLTVSAASMLAACGFDNDAFSWESMKTTVTGKRSTYGGEGPRRQPMLNPLVTPPGAQAEAPAPRAAAAPQTAAPNFATNPYDAYDAGGNPTGPKVTAGQTAPQQESDFLSRLLGRNSAPSADAQRKPLPGNPYYSDETTPAAPLPPAPQTQMPASSAPQWQAERIDAPVLDRDALASAPPSSQAEMQTPIEPQIETQQAPQRQGTWFSRTWNSMKEPFEARPATPQDQAMANEPAPLLSSVPETPPQFQETRTQKQQQLEELQADHMQAQMDRQMLAAEPSQFDATTPVAQDNTVPPVNVQPTRAMPTAPGEPVLLGQVSDSQGTEMPPPPPMSAPLTMPPAQAAMAPAAEPPPAAEPSVAEIQQQTADRQPYWWEGWSLFGEKKVKAKPAMMEEPAQQQAAPPPEPVLMVPQAMPQQPVMQPMYEAAPQEPLPLLAPASPPPVAEMEAAPQEAAPAASSEALPSPAILKQVKMLPPSRYTPRVQSLQRPAHEQ